MKLNLTMAGFAFTDENGDVFVATLVIMLKKKSYWTVTKNSKLITGRFEEYLTNKFTTKTRAKEVIEIVLKEHTDKCRETVG